MLSALLLLAAVPPALAEQCFTAPSPSRSIPIPAHLSSQPIPSTFTFESTLPGHTPPGYLVYLGANVYELPSTGPPSILQYEVFAAEAGRYEVAMYTARSERGGGPLRDDEGNDVWLRMGYEEDWVKLYTDFGDAMEEWRWTTAFDLEEEEEKVAPVVEMHAGWNRLFVAGRSFGYYIDRVVLTPEGVGRDFLVYEPELVDCGPWIESGSGTPPPATTTPAPTPQPTPDGTGSPSTSPAPVGTVMPSPVPGDESTPACFPASAEVPLADGRRVAMSDLAVGDMTAAGGSVFFFSHRDRAVRAQFVRIDYAARGRNGSLTASPGHLIRGGDGGGKLVAAAAVAVGDVLAAEGDGAAEVVGTSRVVASGLFNPHVGGGGDIVVDGIVCSCLTTAVPEGVARMALRIVEYSVNAAGALGVDAAGAGSRILGHHSALLHRVFRALVPPASSLPL